jgi:deazaflavin-dependent oxidoreductase (nitroreductase family)
VNAKDLLFKGLKATHRGVWVLSRGRLGSRVAGMPVVFLTTTGRKSGTPRRTALTAPVVDGDMVVLIASYGGDSRHPQWYLNLVADPKVTIERGHGVEPMTARTATAEEKSALWPKAVEVYRGYAGYQKRTDREIPMVLLTPRNA